MHYYGAKCYNRLFVPDALMNQGPKGLGVDEGRCMCGDKLVSGLLLLREDEHSNGRGVQTPGDYPEEEDAGLPEP